VAVWPTTLPFQDWQFKINFQELVFNERIVFTFRFIELIAAFTLFGYYNPCLDLFYNLELFSGYRNDKRISSAACFKYFGNPIYDSFRCLRWNYLQVTIGCHPAFII